MTTPRSQQLSRLVAPLLIGIILFSAACGRGRGRVLEVAYVSAPQANLRDRVAAVYNKVGFVKNGERVEVLDRDRRFVKVRTSAGAEGWMEQRYLVSQAVYDQIQKLIQDSQNDPSQGEATTRNDTNLHVEPGRATEHLYQLASGEKVTMLRRAAAARPGTPAPRPSTNVERPGLASPPGGRDRKSTETKPASPTPQPILEDWWLVRDVHGRVGWVLARMIDVNLPLDIAQYAEGQRIVAYFVLNEVRDGDKSVPQYLTVLTEPKDGLPFDFNQIRVFTWNVNRHRYETAYRERSKGMLPVIVSHETFEKEGTLPTFTIRVQDDKGTVTERKYKLNTPIVRKVPT